MRYMGFEVLMAVNTKITVSWYVTSYSVVDHYQSFGGTCCFHHQGRRVLIVFYPEDGGSTLLTSIIIPEDSNLENQMCTRKHLYSATATRVETMTYIIFTRTML
jgi:hypothetical protein